MPISFEHAEVMAHSLGIDLLYAKNSKKKRDKKLPPKFYRNLFCASEGHDSFPILQALEKMGYMEQGRKINNGRDTIWFVTDQGIERFKECFEHIINEQ